MKRCSFVFPIFAVIAVTGLISSPVQARDNGCYSQARYQVRRATYPVRSQRVQCRCAENVAVRRSTYYRSAGPRQSYTYSGIRPLAYRAAPTAYYPERRYVRRDYVEREYTGYSVRRPRSKKKSVAIVAGSAGAGAAIGALAGGGKGAGLGALAGGGAGFIYDRLTHNHSRGY